MKGAYMEKGINLAVTRSLADFDVLLDRAIESVSSKNISVAHDLAEFNTWKFQVGKYVQINPAKGEEIPSYWLHNGKEKCNPIFWIGYGWEENENHECILWIEFDAETCPARHWEKINKLAGTSGKYCGKVNFEFVQEYMNAWVHFFIREEFLKQFYDDNADPDVQREILTGFINEVLGNI